MFLNLNSLKYKYFKQDFRKHLPGTSVTLSNTQYNLKSVY